MSSQVLAFQPDAQSLVVSGAGSLARLGLPQGQLLHRLSNFSDTLEIALHHNRLLTLSPQQLFLWRTTEPGKLTLVAEYACSNPRLDYNSRYFLFSLPDFGVALGDWQSGAVLRTFEQARYFHCGPRGKRLLTGAQHSQLHSTSSGTLLAEFEQGCYLASFSPEERWLALAGRHESIAYLIDADRHQVWPIEGHQGHILQLAFSPDGLWLASVGEDGRLLLFDLAQWQLNSFLLDLGPIVHLQWLSGQRLALADDRGHFQVIQASLGISRLQAPQVVQTPGPGGRWWGGPEGLAAWNVPGQLWEFLSLSAQRTLSQIHPFQGDDAHAGGR